MLTTADKRALLKEATEIYQGSDAALIELLVEREMDRLSTPTANMHKRSMLPSNKRKAKTRQDIKDFEMRQELRKIHKEHSL